MKKQLFILILLAFTVAAKAEYNGYHIRISITDTKGRTTAGYVYVAEHYLNLDSLKNIPYLKRALNQDHSKVDTFTFYSHRITYRYIPLGSEKNDKASIYYLLDPIQLPFNSISRIEVRKMIDFSYLSGIAGEFRLRDTAWMKKEPVKQASFGGYLCSYDVFIHKSSKKIENMLLQLEKKQKEYELREAEDPAIYDDHNYGDEKDKFISELIQKLMKDEKVVVITFCTC